MKAVAELQEAQAEIERLNAKIKSLYKEIERIALMTTATDEKPIAYQE